MRIFYILLISLLTGFVPGATGQGELGIIAGISNYQGDLASFSTRDGFRALVGPVLGVHGGYELNKRFQARADLLYTRLSGDDAMNEKEETRSRNLSFFAPVIQLAVGMDWNIFGISAEDPKAFTPYATLGGGLFYFNPKTKYQGEKVALRPLGTEGQFLSNYPGQKPYSRFQASLLLGGGLKFLTRQKYILAIEASMYYTFTDYLDDASTIYISYPELLEQAGPLTAALANRQGEYYGTEPVIVPTGTARANPESRDLFGTITFRASIPIELNPEEPRIKKPNNKWEKNCPKF